MPYKNKADRDTKAEYRKTNSKPEAIRKRAANNAARALMEKKMGHKIPHNMEVDHKVPLAKGGTNAPSNLQVIPRHANRVKKPK